MSKNSYRIYSYFQIDDHTIDTEDAIEIEADQAYTLLQEKLKEPGDYLGLISMDGSTLQFLYKPDIAHYWVEIIDEMNHGCHGRFIGAAELRTLFSSLPPTFTPTMIPGLTFYTWDELQGKCAVTLGNAVMAQYPFLLPMYEDSYFPDELVKKAAGILADVCYQIEYTQPADLPALYAITHAATERINALQEEFWESGSEIETAAREAIAEDFAKIAQTYGFAGADVEEMIAPRDW